MSKHLGTKRFLWVAAGVILVAAAVGLRLMRMERLAQTPAILAAPWAVHLVEVRRGTVTTGFPALATVATASEVSVAPQISGVLLELGPQEGIAVSTGDLLARIDTRELESQVESLRAQLRAAEADAERQSHEARREEQMLAKGGSTVAEVERWRTAERAANDRAESLRKQITAMEVRRDYGTVVAPVGGAIAARLAEPGDMAMPGRPIYRITSTAGVRVTIRLPAEIREIVRPGCPVVLEHGTRQLRVAVARVNPSVDRLAMGTVEVDLDRFPFDLPSGARVSARLVCRTLDDALVIPDDAVLRDAEGSGGRVFRVVGTGDTARLTAVPVEVLLAGAEGLAVDGDIAAGDLIVSGHESVLVSLQEGDRVVSDGGLRNP